VYDQRRYWVDVRYLSSSVMATIVFRYALVSVRSCLGVALKWGGGCLKLKLSLCGKGLSF
jgi:hypothetical protein